MVERDATHRADVSVRGAGRKADIGTQVCQSEDSELRFVPETLRQAFRVYAELFVNRWDVYALQKEDGSYICVRRPLTPRFLWQHLRGEVTLGVYSLDEENRARWLAFDADEDEEWAVLVRLSTGLEERGIPSYLERSRRGGHLWLFLEECLPGRVVRAFGKELLSWEEARMEMFPKGGENKGGPGSLIRLPLGIHLRSGRRYPFVNQRGESLGRSVREQVKALLEVRRVSSALVAEVLAEALSKRQRLASAPGRRSPEGQGTGLIGQLKQVDLYEFVRTYVELAPNGKGHCPFHDDDHMSFSVNREGNYWNCFAGCGGGDIIHFWEKWRGIPRGDAITELSRMCQLEAGLQVP